MHIEGHNRWQKEKKGENKNKQYQITKTKRRKSKKTKQKQTNKQKVKNYFSAYAGRDTVNQAAYHAPKHIKKATDELNSITKQRIDQFISQGGKEVERILPKIICGAIEDIYQTPFRLLRNFGKEHFTKIKRQFIK